MTAPPLPDEPSINLAFTVDPSVQALVEVDGDELEQMAMEWVVGRIPPEIERRAGA